MVKIGKVSLLSIITALALEAQVTKIGYECLENKDVWDYNKNTHKKIEGKNYCGIKSNASISGATLIYDNPKIANEKQKLQIITPNTDAKMFVRGTHSGYSSNEEVRDIAYVPFVVSAWSQSGNVSNNKLMLKAGELSSVYFVSPSDAKEVQIPKKTQGEDNYNFLITAALTQKGNSTNNSLVLQKEAYVNMGVENTYNLDLNGAPYLVGGISFLGNSKNNSIVLEKDSRVDFHPSVYKVNQDDDRVYDERMTHIVGGIAYNGDVIGNQVGIRGSEFIVHGTLGSYSTSVITHIAGGYADVSDGKAHNALNNSLEIDGLDLNLKVDAKEFPQYYDALLFGEFFGGKTAQGKADNNKISLKSLNSYKKIKDGVKIQGLFEFYGGYSTKGSANYNSIDIDLREPFALSETYLGESGFSFYGAYASNGASFNSINIKNNLTNIDVIQNQDRAQKLRDKISIVGARTLAGDANSNVIDFRDSQSALPLYIFAVDKEYFEGSYHYAQNAKNNKITLNNVFSRETIKSGIEAMSVENNIIQYYNVEAQKSNTNKDRASGIFLYGLESAKNNYVDVSNYYSTSQVDIYSARGEVESYKNTFNFKNVKFASDAPKSGLYLIAGTGLSAYENTLSLVDVSLGEYNQKDGDEIYIAASAIPNAQSNLALSYKNTLFIGGEFDLQKDVSINAISGSVIRVPFWQSPTGVSLTSPSPSLAQLSEDNHLITEAKIEARVVNNFEHFSFIYKKKDKKSFITSLEFPINLSRNADFSLYVSKNTGKPKGKIALLESKEGFADMDGNTLNQAEVLAYIGEINKSTNKAEVGKISGFKKENFAKYKLSLSLSEDGKIIYGEAR
ncbi:hypothetical protein B6S12_09430 [Helicobacter valdiviensis]|uniref:Uncharacterized protein n=1 Tax=Helicobacter valdiviensis TaxID=1458358 RepID=A0A2W6NEI9_9HELI|nr:hypothetical protein [Helicobacter valdiviensis]PZT47380.1 hypothetical protein B6S12_09430 [Helicobacter valdiviensis]